MNNVDLPAELVAARATPTFTAATVPAGLLGAHETSVWAELVVVAGSVIFVDETSGERRNVVAGGRCTITPRQRHHVEPNSSAEFFVQFYNTPSP